MWACLHDQRNAKSSPDHYNMPCVHNLHELQYIFIHDMHAHKIASPTFFPSLSYAFTQSLHSGCVLFIKSVKWKTLESFCFLVLLVVLHFIFIVLPINARGSHHVVCRCSKKDSRSFEKKKKRGSTSFASVRECKREGNVSLAPML